MCSDESFDIDEKGDNVLKVMSYFAVLFVLFGPVSATIRSAINHVGETKQNEPEGAKTLRSISQSNCFV